jgi:hypothetical protein
MAQPQVSSPATASPCDQVAQSREEAHELAMACHRLHSQAGMHQGMGMLSQLLGVMDAGVLDEMDNEAADPTYAAGGHEAHQHGLEVADKGMRGASFAVGFLDSMPGMISQFHNGSGGGGGGGVGH